jgi:GDPmannose 4,6-dehydratase
MKKIIITGILGQDGSNLAEYLLNTQDDCFIYGVYKRGSNPNTDNINEIKSNKKFNLVAGDITDQTSLDNIVQDIRPDYFINFAANSFVGTSWGTPEQVFNVNTLGVLKCLEAIRKFSPSCKFYSAGSSEEFGDTLYSPQDEKHPFIPVSPYGVSKTAARHLVDVYRRSYGLFAIHGTLFNHEGPKRGIEFVTRKITKNIAKILVELESTGEVTHSFDLGNVYAHKDWSDSRDMVRGIWMMLQQESPKEFILASGKTRTIKEFVHAAFQTASIDGKWIDDQNPLNEKYEIYVPDAYVAIRINKNLYRPTEVGIQRGDYTAIKNHLGWEPQISFEDMVKDMIENDKNTID